MNIKDVVKWIKDKSCKITLISCEWIDSVREKAKQRLNKYYTYDEVLVILDDATGMYAEFIDNWYITKSDEKTAFSDGAVRPGKEDYYKALIEQLPFCPIYPTNIVPFRVGTTRCKERSTRTRQHNDITKALFSKKIVDKFLKTHKSIQDCGIQPLFVNFYNDKTIIDMHTLKQTGDSMSAMYSDDSTIKQLAKDIVEYQTDMKSKMEAQVKKEQELTEDEEQQEVDTCEGDNCQCHFCKIYRKACQEGKDDDKKA